MDMLINVVLDRSGSMGGLIDSVIEHFNHYKEEVSGLEEDVHMSVYQFDSTYEIIVQNANVRDIPDLTREVYNARGSTALLDAIGKTITQVDVIKDKPAKIVIVINTDGYENASHAYTQSQIKEMVTERQSNHDWQFVFVGAGIDAFTTGTSYGIRGNSTYTSTSDNDGYFASYNVLASATESYSRGATATMDMSIPVAEVKPVKKHKKWSEVKRNKGVSE